MHYIALLVGTLLTLVTGTCVAEAAGLSARLERLLAAIVVSTAQVVTTLLFAGLVLRSLSTTTVLLVTVVITGVAVAISARTTDLRAALRADLGVLRHIGLPRPSTVPLRNWWSWVLGAFVAIETVYIALVVYVLPPASFDGLAYHLTAVAAWLQGDRILITPLNLFANVYPMNGELSFLWIGSLSHSDLLIDGAQFAFAVTGAVAIGAIARTIGVSRPGAFAAASLYLLTPFVLAQATSNYVDLVLPGLFLAGYAFLLRFVLAENRVAAAAVGPSKARTSQLVFAGIAVGLAVGSKSTGVMYGATAGLVLVSNIVWWRRRNGMSWRACGVRVGAFVLPLLLLGSFWYIRTWVEYGNPTYPYRIELAGVTLFDGISPSDVNVPPAEISNVPAPVRSLASWARVPLGYTYEQRLDGFGITWLLFGLPALVVFSIYCALRRRAIFLNFVLPFLAIFVFTPSNWWARFTVLIVAPGAIALVFLIERIRRRTVALVIQMAVIVAVAAGCALSSKRATVLSHNFTARAVASHALDQRSERSLGSLILPEYRWTDLIPEGSRVGVDPEDVPNGFVYALFGSDFRNHVIGLPARALTSSSLAETLHRANIDYFVTRRGSARDYAAQNSDALELVSDVDSVRVYRVSR